MTVRVRFTCNTETKIAGYISLPMVQDYCEAYKPCPSIRKFARLGHALHAETQVFYICNSYVIEGHKNSRVHRKCMEREIKKPRERSRHTERGNATNELASIL